MHRRCIRLGCFVSTTRKSALVSASRPLFSTAFSRPRLHFQVESLRGVGLAYLVVVVLLGVLLLLLLRPPPPPPLLLLLLLLPPPLPRPLLLLLLLLPLLLLLLRL